MAEALCARQIDCMASVATEYGREVMRQQEHLVIREGRMGEPEMEELMRTGTISCSGGRHASLRGGGDGAHQRER